MHANERSTEAAFSNDHIRFHRCFSTGKNQGGVYELDKEGMTLLIFFEIHIKL
jgi:hypothetical protein